MTNLTLDDLGMFDDAVVPVSTQIFLVKQELMQWQNAAYLHKRRYQLSKNLGDGDEVLAMHRKQFEQAVRAIELLTSEVHALEAG